MEDLLPYAVKYGELELVKEMLNASRRRIEERDGNGNTGTHIYTHLEKIKKIA